MKHQIIGLTPIAQDWLENHAKKFVVRLCPHCKGPLETAYESWTYTSPEIRDGGSLPLQAYMLMDGSTIMEVVQTVGKGKGPAAELPLVFLCLKSMDGKTHFEWPDYILRIWEEK